MKGKSCDFCNRENKKWNALKKWDKFYNFHCFGCGKRRIVEPEQKQQKQFTLKNLESCYQCESDIYIGTPCTIIITSDSDYVVKCKKCKKCKNPKECK